MLFETPFGVGDKIGIEEINFCICKEKKMKDNIK